MSADLICPTCRTPYKATAAPGTKLVCDSCMEEFDASGKRTAARTPAPQPVPLPDDGKPIPLADQPTPKPAKAKARPEEKKASAGTAKPRRRRDDDDDGPPRRRRRAKPDGSRTVIYATLGGGLFLLVCVGAGVWLFGRAGDARKQEQARARDVAAAPAEPVQPDVTPNPVPVVPPPPRRPGRSGGNPKPIPPDDPQPPTEPAPPAPPAALAPPPRAIPPVPRSRNRPTRSRRARRPSCANSAR